MITTEQYTGSDCTGNDGEANRTLTLLNINKTNDSDFIVVVNNSFLHLSVDYTVVHNTTGTIITFLNYLWDSQAISVRYSTERGIASAGESPLLPLDTQYVNNEINYFGDTVVVRAVTKLDYDDYGNAQIVLGDSKISYITGEDSNTAFYNATWIAQTFTVGTTAIDLSSLKLYLKRTGTPGAITVSIRAVDGNSKPTGSDLSTSTFTVNDLITDGTTSWMSFHMSAYTLVASTKYAIVVRAGGGDSSNKFDARTVTTGTYSGGNELSSSDSGSIWTANSTDILFDIYGDTDAIAMVDILTQSDDAVKSGQFQSGDKRFQFQNSESNVVRGTLLYHNSLWYEIQEVITDSLGDTNYFIEALAKKI